MSKIMKDLPFDPVNEPCTTLAEKYISEHKHFEEGPREGRCFVFRNGLDMVEKDLLNYKSYRVSGVKLNHQIRRKFTEKLKEEEELFCQLEYLKRKYDAEDTKKQLKLILHYLQCFDAVWNTDYRYPTCMLLVTEDTPLYCLGYLIGGIYCENPVPLYTTMKTAPLCHLFYEVCLHAGIDVPLFYIHEENVLGYYNFSSKGKGCTLVVTEHSDVHSAVDLFLYSSTTAPWKIDRILVQENKIDAVKSVFSSHGKERKMEHDRQYEQQQYETAFETRRGTVAVTIGNHILDENHVGVSPYSTVKELISLLATASPRFLSLWCGNLTQAQEIAAKATTSFIWIDGYADFNGLPEVSLALYNDPLFHTCFDPEAHAQVLQMSNKWYKLTPELRKTIVLKAMEKFELEDELLKVYNSIENWRPKDLALMEDNKLTIVTDCPDQEVIYFFSDRSILPALELLIKGYCIYFQYCEKSTEELIAEMNKDLVPIMTEKEGKKLDMKVEIKQHYGNKKAIQNTLLQINSRLVVKGCKASIAARDS